MKCAVIDHFGPPEMIRIVEMKAPDREGNKIIVEIFASSVNPVDYKVRNGSTRFISGRRFPKNLGGDFSGLVKYSNDQLFPVGSEVFGFVNALKGGAYAEEIAVSKNNLAGKPENLTIYEAGVISIGAMTAFEGIMLKGRVEKGMKVLINGCTGGVGAFASKFAVALGAEVTGTCSERNMEFAGVLGIKHVFDYNTATREEIGNDFDVVFDTSGKLRWGELKRYGRRNTRFVTSAINGNLLWNSILSNRLTLIFLKPDNRKLQMLAEVIEKFNIMPEISGEFELEKLGDAHAALEAGGVRGKILVRIR